MTTPIAMTFQRHLKPTNLPTHITPFMPLDPARTHFSHGPQKHPTSPPRVAVLHNGRVDNHHALRAELQERGYQFQTHSDGELIAHLIDAIHPGDPLQAVQRAMALLQGPSAFAVQFHDHPHRLITAQSGSTERPNQVIDLRA
jgi:glucosamine--fructose-6-phosphate aminotransferase (isomerizing)